MRARMAWVGWVVLVSAVVVAAPATGCGDDGGRDDGGTTADAGDGGGGDGAECRVCGDCPVAVTPDVRSGDPSELCGPGSPWTSCPQGDATVTVYCADCECPP